jgi:hypothetical protein
MYCKFFSGAVGSEKHGAFLQNETVTSASQRRRTSHGKSYYCSRIPLIWKMILHKNNLHIFERQILRKIFGPVNIGNIWRI